jgi:endonuclease III related protein
VPRERRGARVSEPLLARVNPAFLDLPFGDRYRAFEMSASIGLPQIVTASPGSLGHAAERHSFCGTPGTSQPLAPSQLPASGNAPLGSYFKALFAAHGPQQWWPGRSRFEIIVGAVLTQNTSWKNVERALSNLRSAKLLSLRAIREVRTARLAACLRPSGYFRQKSKTLKTFVAFLFAKHGGSLNRLFGTPTEILRDQLVSLRGIGPETADCILLYAGRHPVFVVDAYARRVLERHRLAHPKATYEQLRATFESALPRDHRLFNEFHALIVRTGKHHCRKTAPDCSTCPLAEFLPRSGDSQFTTHQAPVTPP